MDMNPDPVARPGWCSRSLLAVGMAVLAGASGCKKYADIYENTGIRDNQTVNLTIVSYFLSGKPIKDKSYDPYPESIYIHDNTFSGGGTAPSGLRVKLLALKLGKPFPDILYDGIANEKKLTAQGATPDELKLCIRDNGDADFANIDGEHKFENMRRELAPHDCTHPSPEPVQLSGISR